MSIRHREVAVAVIFDQASESFLLCQNRGWSGYAFPMKRFDAGSGQPAVAAVQALRDWDFPLPVRIDSATPLDHHLEALRSGSAGEVTLYEYHAFAVQLASALPPTLPLELKLLKYDQLQDAVNVTTSTKAIARSLVEDRRVAVAVITRESPTGPEFLLINKPGHGYFFPATRIKTDVHPAAAAVDAAVADLGHEGPWEVTAQAPEVPALKQSARFGAGERRFHYHLCRLNAPRIEPPAAHWRWATERQLREGANLSRSMPAVLQTALQLAEDSRAAT